MFSRITFILGWLWYFSMACRIVTASLYEELLVRPSISRFWTMFPKYLLKIPTNLLSSETTLLFSTKVIISSFKVLSVTEGFTVFQKKNYFRWCILHWGYCKTPQKFLCLLYADLVASAISFLYLCNNLKRFLIAFYKILFINLAWLYLTYLSFEGVFFSSIILEIFINQAKSLDCLLLEDNP